MNTRNLSTVNPMPSGEGDIDGFISSRLMAAYKLDDHTLHVSREGQNADGRVIWRYVLEHCDDVIFDGQDFSTPSYWTYGEAAHGVLGFLTLQDGDTDSEFFDSYTPEQLAWRDEHAMHLSIYAAEPEDNE